jgi:predicted small lipoprotein YifL
MRITLLAALFATVLSGSLLSGCGQKGPLFIPSETPTQPSPSNQ